VTTTNPSSESIFSAHRIVWGWEYCVIIAGIGSSSSGR
jgi:hypothetical protein